jgi:putative ABC transport system permease protein
MRMTLIKKGRRELWEHKAQYILLIVILGMGIGMYTSMFDFMGTREATMTAIEDQCRFMDFEISTQYGTLLDKQIAQDMLMDSPVRDSIIATEYRMVIDVYLNHTSIDGEKMTKGLVYGYDYDIGNGEHRAITVNKPLFFDSDITSFASTDDLSCYLEVNFAQYYNIASGDIITLVKDNQEIEITVLEIINVPDYLDVVSEGSMFPIPDSLGVLIVPYEMTNSIMNVDSSENQLINNIIIRVTEEADVDIIKEELIKVFEDEQIPVTVIKGEDNPAWAALLGDLEGDKEFMGMFPGIIFIISGIGLVIALRRMVRSHRPQIGIFKAMGVPNTTILIYFLIIGLIIALCSILFGYILSFPLKIMFNGLMDEMLVFAVRDYATYPEYYIYSAIIALFLCITCTLLPALSAVRAKPIDVIQKREGLGKLKSKRRMKNILSTNGIPTPFKMVGRDISRKPVRTLTTIFGVALSLALFLSVVIMFDSFFVFLDETKEVNMWDYEIGISGFSQNTLGEKWIDDYVYIETANPGLRLPANLSKNEQSVDVLIFGLDNIEQSLNIGVKYVGEDGLYISKYIAEELSISKGDFVDIEILRLKEGYNFSTFSTELEVLDIHNNPLGVFIYADISVLYRLTKLDGFANFYLIHTGSKKLPPSSLNRIAQTENVVAVTHVGEQETYLDQMFDLIIGFIFMMILISVVLATAIVYNLFKIGAIEKSRDYATMKTLGTSIKRISYLIFIEGLVTLIGGLSLGSIGGYYMSYFMLVGNELLEGISMDVVFSWTGLIMGAVVLTCVVVMVSFLTIRFINKINIADVIRDRSTG